MTTNLAPLSGNLPVNPSGFGGGAASMAGATAYMVTGMIHNWPLAAPELFNRTLRAWLTDGYEPLPAELVPVPRR